MADFVRKRLSKEALDAYVSRYTADKPSKSTIEYTKADGSKVLFDIRPVVLDKDFATAEFHYFLGQTLPYHDRKDHVYPISSLAYIINEQGKPVPWTKNLADVAYFVKIGASAANIQLVQNKTSFALNPYIPAVVHKEKEHGDR